MNTRVPGMPTSVFQADEQHQRPGSQTKNKAFRNFNSLLHGRKVLK